MKPAVKMLHQKFRCKQRIIRPQETEKLPPLLFPALVVTPPSGRGLVIPVFTPPSGRGLVIPVFFFFFFLSWSVAPDLRSVKTILAGKLCSFSVYSPEFS